MAIDELTYPLPVANRVVASASPAPAAVVAAGGTPPRTRIFTFSISANAGTRSARSSAVLHGPAVIHGLHLGKTNVATVSIGYGLGKHTSAITETNVAIATSLPFAPLFEDMLPKEATVLGVNRTDPAIDLQTNTFINIDDVGIIVLDPEFFLVVYVAVETGGTGNAIAGHVTILEGVSPEALANFL